MEILTSYKQISDKIQAIFGVDVSNEPAIHLYEKFGFKSLGLRKKYYEGKFDAILMSKKL